MKTNGKILLLSAFMGIAPGVFAQLSGSVNVQGEYEPLVIETERLNAFPQGYRFELPAANLSYEYTGVVTDFRPDLLTMGVTGRLTDWPWKKRRGFIDLNLGSYLDSRLHAGYYILADSTNTLLADVKFRSTAYRDSYAIPDPERTRLLEGELGFHYSGHFGDAHTLRAALGGGYTGYDQGNREGSLTAQAGYAYKFSDYNALGIDARGDFLFPHKIYNNYGVISLKPSYRYANGRLEFHAGMDVALTYDALGKLPDEKFGTVHVAPDIDVQYRINRSVGVFLKATGGVTPSTIMTTRDTDPFWMPWLFSPRPLYRPLEAHGGVGIGPLYGFSVSAALRYDIARNVPLEAWRDLTEGFGMATNLHGFGVELDINYRYGTIVELGFSGSYVPQKDKRGIFNGFDRPRWVIEAKGGVRPVKKLHIEIGYDYRGVRNCYTIPPDGTPEGLRLPDITGLKGKITYSILDNFDIYVMGTNLLNHHTDLVPGIESEGIAIAGGFYFKF